MLEKVVFSRGLHYENRVARGSQRVRSFLVTVEKRSRNGAWREMWRGVRARLTTSTLVFA